MHLNHVKPEQSTSAEMRFLGKESVRTIHLIFVGIVSFKDKNLI